MDKAIFNKGLLDPYPSLSLSPDNWPLYLLMTKEGTAYYADKVQSYAGMDTWRDIEQGICHSDTPLALPLVKNHLQRFVTSLLSEETSPETTSQSRNSTDEGEENGDENDGILMEAIMIDSDVEMDIETESLDGISVQSVIVDSDEETQDRSRVIDFTEEDDDGVSIHAMDIDSDSE